MKKYLFLDVDGVLNCAEYFNTRETPRDLRPREMDPFRVLLVHRICEATGAKVVVSSSWRLDEESLAEVREALGDLYLDKTPRLNRFEDRHQEIRDWLSANGGGRYAYAVLDDDEVAGTWHGENFFRTQWYGPDGGLNQAVADRVVAHLNASPS